MTRDILLKIARVYAFIGMSINNQKQAEENRKAIVEETGIDSVATYLNKTPEILVLEGYMQIICDALSQKPKIEERDSDEYPHKASLTIAGVKVSCICKSVPEWAV